MSSFEGKILRFNSDTKHRKSWFTGISFSHPAKMMLPLELWIIDNYTKSGETILDPMAGSGTVMVACSMGRNVICVELEKKFCDMMAGNWEKIKQRGPQLGCSMGTCLILQGDTRNLEGILVDKIITSPPYAEQVNVKESGQDKRAERLKKAGLNPVDYQGGTGRNLQQDWKYGDNPSNLGNLSYGSIDSIITSPPYEEGGGHGGTPSNCALEKHQSSMGQGTEQLYGKTDGNIGNLKSNSYFSAMLQVYKSCFAVLKPGGLMILVTKNFIRNQKEVRLDLDTIRLCEQAGFGFKERWYRELTQQSFWRTIYAQRYPSAPQLKYEDILVFAK